MQCTINIVSATKNANESDIIHNFNLAQNPFLQATLKDNEAKLIQISNLNNTIKEKDNIINSNINHINQLQSNIQERSTQLNQIQSKLFFQTKYGTAKI
ncbi:hypothetical protein LFZ69_001801, partial [Campylobacter coli]|nr:hypothetical protein [Campylobacter coli]EIF8178944.1 hypothetical protein [Campylobacter coli]